MKVERYSLHELLTDDFPSSESVVDGLLYIGENSTLVAPEKSGKTIFGQQLALSVVLGIPFAGLWKVKQPRDVLYVSMEGTMHELQSMDKRLLHYMNKYETDARGKFTLAKVPFLPLDTDEGYESLASVVLDVKPHLLVIDPWYRLMKSSMKDDFVTNLVTARLNVLQAENPNHHATFVEHHQHRAKIDPFGGVIEEGRHSYFGSAFFAAWANNMYRMEFDKIVKQGTLHADSERTPRFGLTKALVLYDTPEDLAFIAEDEPLTEVAQAILDVIDQVEGKSMREIAKLVQTTQETGRQALRELHERGHIKLHGGKRGLAMKVEVR